jgi:uncharacterized protein YodC (DUF2158 family)
MTKVCSECEESMDFKIGDVVGLNSGGPPMTVTCICKEYDEVVCTWFAGKKMEQKFLTPVALHKYDD